MRSTPGSAPWPVRETKVQRQLGTCGSRVSTGPNCAGKFWWRKSTCIPESVRAEAGYGWAVALCISLLRQQISGGFGNDLLGRRFELQGRTGGARPPETSLEQRLLKLGIAILHLPPICGSPPA